MVGPPCLLISAFGAEMDGGTVQTQSTCEHGSGAGCFARIYWMVVGNALLFILFGLLMQKPTQALSLLDAGCLLAVASLVWVRYIDIRHLKGQTVEATPASLADWRRYATILVPGSFAVWLTIKFLVPLVMK